MPRSLAHCFISFTMLVLLSAGCKKNDAPAGPLGNMPDHFVQRVMIEELTAEWCPTCPHGDSTLDTIRQRYGDTVVIVSIHWQDAFDKALTYEPVIDSFGQTNGYFPSAAINRIQDLNSTDFWYGTQDWLAAVSTQVSADNKTGIALVSTVIGDSATIEVHIGFHATNAYDMRLNVFLVENNVPQQNQDGGYPGYIHQDVLRAIVTPVLGAPFSMNTMTEVVKKYRVSIAGYNASNLVFATSVSKWGTAPTDRHVFNARKVAVGQTAKWQ